MMNKDPKDYTDLSIQTIIANIGHYRSKIEEVEQLLEYTKREKIFWIKVKNLKQSVL